LDGRIATPLRKLHVDTHGCARWLGVRALSRQAECKHYDEARLERFLAIAAFLTVKDFSTPKLVRGRSGVSGVVVWTGGAATPLRQGAT
jgi:hypothetical protein